MTVPQKGSILVASPALGDPNFRRSVVLLLAYDVDGALGVVLNRPGNAPIMAVAPTWVDHAAAPRVMFTGGPVQQDAAICVGCPRRAGGDAPGERGGARGEGLSRPGGALAGNGSADEPYLCVVDEPLEPGPAEGYAPITSLFGTIDLRRDPEDVPVSFAGLRVYRGYAGWGAGQLDDEIEHKGWFVLDGFVSDVLTPEPDRLWERVLGRQGGWLSVLSRHPVDPSLN